jgi:hypothetical protein
MMKQQNTTWRKLIDFTNKKLNNEQELDNFIC